MYNKTVSIKMVVLAMMMLLAVMMPLSAFAQEEARVYFREVEASDNLLQVEVRAENVSDLYGMEFEIEYNPAVVAVKDAATDQDGVQIEPGTLLPVDKGFLVVNEADAAKGTINLALTLLNPAPAVSGEGTLAVLTFERLQEAESTLKFAELNLVSSDMHALPHQAENFTLGGNNDGGSFIWLLVGGAVAVVILLVAVGGFVMMGQSKSKATSQPAQGQTSTKRSKASI